MSKPSVTWKSTLMPPPTVTKIGGTAQTGPNDQRFDHSADKRGTSHSTSVTALFDIDIAPREARTMPGSLHLFD